MIDIEANGHQHPYGTGKTFRLLLRACTIASEGHDVMVVATTSELARTLRDIAYHMAAYAKPRREGTYYLGIASNSIRFRDMEWYKKRRHTVNSDVRILFD